MWVQQAKMHKWGKQWKVIKHNVDIVWRSLTSTMHEEAPLGKNRTIPLPHENVEVSLKHIPNAILLILLSYRKINIHYILM